MQTPAERHLISRLCDFLLESRDKTGLPAVLNIGAGRSTIIEGRLIDCKGVTGRYIRLYSNGSTAGDMNHYVEVEVYGTPAGNAEAPPR